MCVMCKLSSSYTFDEYLKIQFTKRKVMRSIIQKILEAQYPKTK